MKDNTENYTKHYLPHLEKLYESGFTRIHFHHNPKYPAVEGCNVYYIGFSDIFAYKYIIRAGIYGKYNDDTDPIVASYDSLKAILEDGWRLD